VTLSVISQGEVRCLRPVVLTFVTCIFYCVYNEQSNAPLIDSLLYCYLFIVPTKCELPEDDTLALKHVGAINKEQYNKLSIKCVFVSSLYILFMTSN